MVVINVDDVCDLGKGFVLYVCLRLPYVVSSFVFTLCHFTMQIGGINFTHPVSCCFGSSLVGTFLNGASSVVSF